MCYKDRGWDLEKDPEKLQKRKKQRIAKAKSDAVHKAKQAGLTLTSFSKTANPMNYLLAIAHYKTSTKDGQKKLAKVEVQGSGFLLERVKKHKPIVPQTTTPRVTDFIEEISLPVMSYDLTPTKVGGVRGSGQRMAKEARDQLDQLRKSKVTKARSVAPKRRKFYVVHLALFTIVQME